MATKHETPSKHNTIDRYNSTETSIIRNRMSSGSSNGSDGSNHDASSSPSVSASVVYPRFVCSICKEETIDEPVLTHCGHLYCWSCLYQWLQHNTTCPVCKKPCSFQQVIKIYGVESSNTGEYQQMSTLECVQLEDEFIAAMSEGNLDKIKECVRKGVNVKAQRPGFSSGSALNEACEKGYFEIVQYLVQDCHMDVTKKSDNDDEWTALCCASLFGHFEIVQYLVLRYCDVDANTKENHILRAFHQACGGGELEIVQYFVQDCHVDVNATNNNGSTGLHCACDYGNLKIVQYLVQDCHVDTSIEDNDGRTALYWANRWKYLDVVQYLIADA